jgi:hypothetical protein
MKCSYFSIVCLVVGLGAGSVAGHYHGVAVTLQASMASQMSLYTALADNTETHHARR